MEFIKLFQKLILLFKRKETTTKKKESVLTLILFSMNAHCKTVTKKRKRIIENILSPLLQSTVLMEHIFALNFSLKY